VCSNLSSITIPDSVTTIETYACYNNEKAETLYLGASVNSIADYALSQCYGLKSITVSSSNTKYDSREDCNAIVLTSSNEIMVACQNTVILDSVTRLGKYAYRGILSGEFVVPDQITYIGSYCFSSNSKLTSLVIGSGVTYIDDSFVSYASNLKSITCKATTAPLVSSNFARNIASNGVLYYPCGSDYSQWLSTDGYYLGYYGWTYECFEPTEE
jgi:hypothetical protein